MAKTTDALALEQLAVDLKDTDRTVQGLCEVSDAHGEALGKILDLVRRMHTYLVRQEVRIRELEQKASTVQDSEVD
jgi:hypothetical protein